MCSITLLGKQDWDWTASLSPGYLGGHAVYQIGGTYMDSSAVEEFWFPMSVLDFPINDFGIKAQVGLDAQNWSVNYEYGYYYNSAAGVLVDEDYGITSGGATVDPDTLTIYSRSDTASDAYRHYIEFLLEVGRSETQRLSMGCGYLYNHLFFEARDTFQSYPSEPNKGTSYISGKVLTYELNYSVPLFVIQYGLSIQSFEIDLKYSLSPYAVSHEIDHHIKRERRSRGDGAGSMILFETIVRYPIAKHMSAFLEYNYTKTEMNGVYENTFYNNSSISPYTIDFLSYSSQSWVTLGVQYEY